jgi:probable rRNA maturation factor
MTLVLAFSLEHDGWSAILGDVEALCLRAADAAIAEAGLILSEGVQELSLVLADDATVQPLNLEWRGQDRPTNVLSFPALEPDQIKRWRSKGLAPTSPQAPPLLLGDVILAFETCQKEAEADHKDLADHLGHLVIHGVLHLLGYDHLTEEEACEMEALEIASLKKLEIANPYQDSDV